MSSSGVISQKILDSFFHLPKRDIYRFDGFYLLEQRGGGVTHNTKKAKRRKMTMSHDALAKLTRRFVVDACFSAKFPLLTSEFPSGPSQSIVDQCETSRPARRIALFTCREEDSIGLLGVSRGLRIVHRFASAFGPSSSDRHQA